MTRIIERLDEVAGGYRAVLCDLWGCYHDGIAPFPAAVAALRRYRAAGGIVVLLTNAPRPAAHVRRFLDAMAAPTDTHDAIMSSGEACLGALAEGRHGRRILYVGPDRDRHMLADAGLAPASLDEAQAILCTGLENEAEETPDDYAGRIADWRARGLPMLCANPDIVVDKGEVRLWCAGAIARAYAQAGGEVVYFGKPHRPIYEMSFGLLKRLAGAQVAPEEVLAIGDGISTDIRGARDYGLDALFVSGGLAARELGGDPERPDPARLEAWLAAEGERPDYAIGRLR